MGRLRLPETSYLGRDAHLQFGYSRAAHETDRRGGEDSHPRRARTGGRYSATVYYDDAICSAWTDAFVFPFTRYHHADFDDCLPQRENCLSRHDPKCAAWNCRGGDYGVV